MKVSFFDHVASRNCWFFFLLSGDARVWYWFEFRFWIFLITLIDLIHLNFIYSFCEAFLLINFRWVIELVKIINSVHFEGLNVWFWFFFHDFAFWRCSILIFIWILLLNIPDYFDSSYRLDFFIYFFCFVQKSVKLFLLVNLRWVIQLV